MQLAEFKKLRKTFLLQDLKQSKFGIVSTLLCFVVAGFMALFVVEKGDVVLQLITGHNIFWDAVFLVITYFGDLPVLIPALAIMFFVMPFRNSDKKWVFLKLLIVLTAMLIVLFVLKILVFNLDRPVLFFQKTKIVIPEIAGMNLRQHYSFPSGHSATGFFAWYVWFHLIFVNKSARYYWFIPAILVAFSRVYLGQHFFQDICAGAFIGYSSAVILVWWIGKTKKPR